MVKKEISLTDSSDMTSNDTSVTKSVKTPLWFSINKKLLKKKRSKIHDWKKKKKKPYNPAAESYTSDELDYYKKQSIHNKTKIATTESLLKNHINVNVPQRFQILLANMDCQSKAIALQKLNTMMSMESSSSEYHKLHTWVNAVCKIPFGNHKALQVSHASPLEDIRKFLQNMRESLDTKVYGHIEAKDHIIRMLAQWISNPTAKGLVLGIQGDAGVGKTSLIKQGICTTLGIPFAFIPLGGASDAAYLEGHSYTYEGAVWGRIVDVLMKAECMNPVIFFDELDKVSKTGKGDEIINCLMHLTDATQNDKFHDRYFSDFEFDLSRSIIIFTYNNEDEINPILRDRMIKIYTNGYNMSDKVAIAQRYMIPEILPEFGMSKDAVVFDDTIIKNIVDSVETEEGVRNLRRGIHNIISNIHFDTIMKSDHVVLPVKVTDEYVTKYIKKQSISGKQNKLHSMMYI
jgi:ATP-dependent Lon protease